MSPGPRGEARNAKGVSRTAAGAPHTAEGVHRAAAGAPEARHPSWWERNLPAPPPPAVDLPTRTDVLIVGAGFMGRWLAYFLSKRPAPPSVLVVERDRFTYGASSRNAGFLTCGQVSEMLADLEAVGEEAVVDTFLRRLEGIEIVRREFPDLATEACGSLDWDPPDGAKRALGEALNDAAGREVYGVREARLGRETREVIFNAVDGALDPVQLLRRLADATHASFAHGVTARRVAGGVALLDTPAGPREVACGHAFLCINAFTHHLHEDTEVRPGRGQIVVTTPVESPTTRALGYLNAGYDYFRFVGDRLLIGGGRHRFAHENGPTDLEPTEEVRAYLTEVAARVIGHDDFAVAHHWAGIMGFRGGRHLGGSPRDVLDSRTEAVAGFGGMGVALTPGVAREIAEAV
ncbi:MAG: FAD-dependent oxidoreductase [Longimicrobiales bacterium]|nr:FAD-dependent oxidoreductase [Longimicrobiales bacterium]